jgi:hypothetical protein
MAKREGFGTRMEQNLADFDTRLAAVEARGGASADRVAAMRAAGAAAETKLRELKEAAYRYGLMRDELDAAWKALASSLAEVDPKSIAAAS